MKEPLRDQSEEVKATHRVTEDASDEAWLYCDNCHRAMAQGDCVLDDLEGGLRCAYDDCGLEGTLAYQSLYGWDAYRQAHAIETAHWPTEPVLGARYERRAAP